MNQPDFKLPTNYDQVAQACAAASVAFANFVALLQKAFNNQLTYDLQVNLPNRIVTAEAIPDHTLKVALATAVGEYYHWEADAVTRRAAEILEDSNLHHLAADLFEHCDT